MIYFFDCVFEGGLGVLVVFFVGILVERVYGYRVYMVIFENGFFEEVLVFFCGLFVVMVIFFGFCCLCYILFYFIYVKDKEEVCVYNFKYYVYRFLRDEELLFWKL